jgi:uncharacterized protein YndB with AHSA1/START domain
MFAIDQSIVIKRPAEAVFRFIADPANIPKWRPEVIEVGRVAGPLREGAEFTETFNFMGRKTATMRVTGFEPGRRLVLRALSGPMLRPTQTFEFAAAEGGTRVAIHIDMEVDAWATILQFLFRPMIRKLWAKYLATLKRLLESA